MCAQVEGQAAQQGKGSSVLRDGKGGAKEAARASGHKGELQGDGKEGGKGGLASHQGACQECAAPHMQPHERSAKVRCARVLQRQRQRALPHPCPRAHCTHSQGQQPTLLPQQCKGQAREQEGSCCREEGGREMCHGSAEYNAIPSSND